MIGRTNAGSMDYGIRRGVCAPIATAIVEGRTVGVDEGIGFIALGNEWHKYSVLGNQQGAGELIVVLV